MEGRAGDERLHEGVEGVGVKEGQTCVQDVVIGDAEHLPDQDPPPIELGLRATHALGQASGSRGVEDRRGIPGTDRSSGHRGPGGRRSRHRVAGGAVIGQTVERPHELKSRGTFDVAQHADELGVNRQPARSRVVELMGQLRAAQRGVERDRDRAQPRASKDEIKQLDAVLTHERDSVTRNDACAAEGARRGRNHAAGIDDHVGIDGVHHVRCADC